MKFQHAIVLDRYYAQAHAGGLVSVYGGAFARSDNIILRRVDRHGNDLSWGHLFGPLAAMPGQSGELAEMRCDDQSSPTDPAAWSETGRRWPLDTPGRDIVSDVLGLKRGTILPNCYPVNR